MERRPAQPQDSLAVLVADDDPSVGRVIAAVLARLGFRASIAADAAEALRLASESVFDVALIDARMPGDGVALRRKLEALPALRGRTVLMSGGGRPAGVGADEGPFLAKPFDFDAMVRLVRTVARRAGPAD